MAVTNTANKRSFFRVHFPHPMLAELKVIGGPDQIDPDAKRYKAALLDLSAGGARFCTTAPLPELHTLLAELRFTALGTVYRPLGVVVRSILSNDGHYEYSTQFYLEEADTAQLASMLNQLALKLRKTPTASGCSFCADEDLDEFPQLLAGAAR